MKKNYCVGK